MSSFITMPATFSTVTGRTSVIVWNSPAISIQSWFDGEKASGSSWPRAMYWYPVPDAIRRRSTPTGVPSASVMPALLNSVTTSVIHPSVPSPDFSVDAQISTTSAALGGAATLISNSSRSGRVSERSAPVGGGIDALRVIWLSTQPISSASSSSCCDASAGSSGSEFSPAMSPQAATTSASPASVAATRPLRGRAAWGRMPDAVVTSTPTRSGR